MDWQEYREYMDRIRSRLEKERQDLRDRARRAKKEAGEELDKMEETWKAFASRVSEVELSEVTEDVKETAERLAAELREGYSKLRDRLGDQGKGAGAGRATAETESGGEPKPAAAREEAGRESAAADAEVGREAVYTMGYSEEFRRVLERRSAQTHASDLLPLLRQGMRVLDFGCGTGSISVGLAKAVEPGELHGIDLEESQIEIARAAAKAGGHDNASFQAGDAASLPFEDEWFDAAHCNAVLMHVPGAEAVLAEVNRVLKPGGILSVRELNTPSSFFEPDCGGIDGAWKVFAQLLAANGGHPGMGREITGLLRRTGWSDVEANGSFELFRSEEDRAFFHRFVGEWFFSEDTVRAATGHGLVAEAELDGWRKGLDEWKDRPGALAAFAWGGAIARKPGLR